MQEFKDMLNFFRMRANLSQSELAEKLGVAASTISMYEVGKREPDFETEEKIADFLTLTIIHYAAATMNQSLVLLLTSSAVSLPASH